MGLQIIFCLETDSQSRTDWVYISETIKRYYKVTNEIKLSPIFLGGKGNYRIKRVIKQIQQFTNQYKNNGQTVVIYCIDTDNLEIIPERKREFNEIKDYCRQYQYEFIWFCRDIEEVYLGNRVDNNNKTRTAAHFRQNKMIDSLDKSQIMSNQIYKGRSNILCVLDKYIKTR